MNDICSICGVPIEPCSCMLMDHEHWIDSNTRIKCVGDPNYPYHRPRSKNIKRVRREDDK